MFSRCLRRFCGVFRAGQLCNVLLEILHVGSWGVLRWVCCGLFWLIVSLQCAVEMRRRVLYVRV